MKKALIFLTALIALSLNASQVSAEKGDPDDGPPMRGPGHMGRGHHEGMFFGDPEVMKEKLSLTDEQVAKIGDINLNYKKKLLAIKEKVAPKRIKLAAMLLEDSVDLEKVRPMLKEISDLQVEIRMLRITQRLDIEKILTPAQRTKLRNFMMGRMKMGPPAEPPDEGDTDMEN